MRTYINDVVIDKTNRICGFVENIRNKRTMAFIVLRDVSGKIQLTVEKEKHPELIETIVKMSPDRVVMVSCDSATAARDAGIFDTLGYKLQKLQAVDMFPRTNHIECVLKLCREV